MKKINIIVISACILVSSCVSKSKFATMKNQYTQDLKFANEQLGKSGLTINELNSKLGACEAKSTSKDEQMKNLFAQIEDLKVQRDKQYSQVGDMTILTQKASDNIKETLSQLEKKDKYIHLLQAAKTKADSLNLALSVNIKNVLKDGVADDDVEVKVDKTVVMVNLSDKMLFEIGSSNLSAKANNVLGKIAQILEARPELEVMVEGYTDNIPIKNACMDDNWDLSVKRSTTVVRTLQTKFKVDPNRLIAAGRSEYNKLTSNDTPFGRAINRRTRIILLPKLDQFYELLNPDKLTDIK
jgi:chemotaxis protein MotB